VPLPVDVESLNVSQVPPPVTALDVPPLAGPTKVPEPVSLIDRVLGFLAEANATPPALIVGGLVVASKWMTSQRTWSAAPSATEGRKINARKTAAAKDTAVLAKRDFPLILILLLLSRGFDSGLPKARLPPLYADGGSWLPPLDNGLGA
jgi:hypothetical protein